MGVDGNAAEVLLGLPGFRLLAVSEAGGEVDCDIETVRDRDFCRSCGVLARLHGRRTTLVRDLSAGGRPCGCAGASGCGDAPSRRVR